MLALNRRINGYVVEHPWRWAIGSSATRRGRPMPGYQKLSFAALALVGFFVLGSLLEVTGVLR